MKRSHLTTTLPQLCNPVNTQLPLFPGYPPRTMIHHKISRVTPYLLLDRNVGSGGDRYGVSSSRRVLSPGLFRQRYDQIRNYLQHSLGLTICQREVTLKLLRLFAYYGEVYPKAAHIAIEPGSSRATFWRTVKILRDKRLLEVVNRFFIRPHAQASNLYILDKLVLLIARYLAEHGVAFYQQWLKPYLAMPGSLFWRKFADVGLPLECDFPGVGG